MKIYIGHPKQFDYKKNLYEPIRNSGLDKEHEIIFPHEKDELLDSRDLIKSCDLMIAEVSLPSTGLGIELGWADCLGVPIICMHKKGSSISDSLKMTTDIFIEYSDGDEMVSLLENELKNNFRK